MSLVLVVDDASVDRILFKGIIERMTGFSVVEAENGLDAIEKIGSWNIDLVVTDLQMPKMDGLELVKQIRMDYPRVPVILATGHGSDEIANQALADGAAGYVPKSKLNELLIPTIRNLLARMKSVASLSGLLERTDDLSIRLELENDQSQFLPLIDFCKQTIEGISDLDYMDILRVGIAIEQALHNALFRGNLEIPSTVMVPFGDEAPDEMLRERIRENLADPQLSSRRIRVNVHTSPAEFTCVIRDDGPGFNPKLYEEWESTDTARGLVLMKTFMDRVIFSESGNEVTLIAYLGGGIPEGAARQEVAMEPGRQPSATAAGTETETAVQGNTATLPRESVLGMLTSINSGRSVKLRKDRLVVGTARTCHIALAASSVSRHHCLLFFKQGAWYVKDLKSEAGVFVNGRRVERSQLKPRDMLEIGDRKLKIDY